METPSLPRRTVLAAGVWAAPAITVVAAAPALAASGPKDSQALILFPFQTETRWDEKEGVQITAIGIKDEGVVGSGFPPRSKVSGGTWTVQTPPGSKGRYEGGFSTKFNAEVDEKGNLNTREAGEPSGDVRIVDPEYAKNETYLVEVQVTDTDGRTYVLYVPS